MDGVCLGPSWMKSKSANWSWKRLVPNWIFVSERATWLVRVNFDTVLYQNWSVNCPMSNSFTSTSRFSQYFFDSFRIFSFQCMTLSSVVDRDDDVEEDGAMVREKVTSRDIAGVVSRATGIPIMVSC